MRDLSLQLLLRLRPSVDVEYDHVVMIKEMETHLPQRNLSSGHAPRDLGIIEKARNLL
jgi:hypothetical protein